MSESSENTLILEWTRSGPALPAAALLPPQPIDTCDYFLTVDEHRHSIIYAYSHEHHQFGHTWEWDGKEWKELCTRAFRGGSVEQDWQGFYDAGREGVMAWNFDDEVAVAVLIKGKDIQAFMPDGEEDCEAEGISVIITSGEQPEVEEGDWDELLGVFAYNKKRDVTVCLTQVGVWEMDAAGVWKKCFSMSDGLLPEDCRGDRNHGSGGSGAFYDALNERVLFWLVDMGKHELCMLAWDGTELSPVSNAGLPEKIFTNRRVGSAALCGHSDYSAVLYAGETIGYFGLSQDDTDGQDDWQQLDAGDNPAPRGKGASMVYDSNTKTLMLGPGEYEKRPGGSGEKQHLFYTSVDGVWNKQGNTVQKSFLDEVVNSDRHKEIQYANEQIYAVSWRDSLHTAIWRKEDDWEELIDKYAPKKAFAGESSGPYDIFGSLLEGKNGSLLAISEVGEIFRFIENDWERIADAFPEFKQRESISCAYNPDEDKIIVWGGTIKERQSNDTLIYHEGSWAKAKKPSPKPKDFSHGKDDIFVEYDMIYDTALKVFIRFGFEDVAVFDGEVWDSYTPENYKSLIHSRHRTTVHDAQSGETLIVNFHDKTIIRFDFLECTLLGRFDWPENFIPFSRFKSEGENPWSFPYAKDYVYDADNKKLITFNRDNMHEVYGVDLTPAFNAAAKLGDRSEEIGLPKKSESAGTNLYFVDEKSNKFYFAHVKDAQLTRNWGGIDALLGGKKISEKIESFPDHEQALKKYEEVINEKQAKGYRIAEELEKETLISLGTRSRWDLSVGEKRQKGSMNHFGGLPVGVSQKKWPLDDNDYPMAFLFQVKFPAEMLPGYAGVAVFCNADGDATEDPENNHAVLLTEKDLKDGVNGAPDNTSVLPEASIQIGAPSFDLNDEALGDLLEKDPLMAQAFETLGEELGEQSTSKLGGVPVFIQGGDVEPGQILLAQLDFDEINIEDPEEILDDVGLTGAIYVFADKKGKKTHAFWEYT